MLAVAKSERHSQEIGVRGLSSQYCVWNGCAQGTTVVLHIKPIIYVVTAEMWSDYSVLEQLELAEPFTLNKLLGS